MTKILISIFLSLFISMASGGTMYNQEPIQERLKKEQRSECKQKIEYYRERLREYPNNTYYKFLLKKWLDRCEKE